MDKNRIWIIAGALVIVMVAALGWVLGVQPQLDIANANDAQRAGVEAQNLVHHSDLNALKAKYEQLPQLKKELETLRASIPATADLDTLIGELHALEGSNDVKVTALTTLDATAFIPSVEIASTVPASISATNFVAIPIKLTVKGNTKKALEFVEALQTGDRLFLVSDLAFTPIEGKKGEASADISGLVYVLLDKPIAAATDATATPGKTDATGATG
jgi:Tfp pilus assembly protein PilO